MLIDRKIEAFPGDNHNPLHENVFFGFEFLHAKTEKGGPFYCIIVIMGYFFVQNPTIYILIWSAILPAGFFLLYPVYPVGFRS